MFASFIRTIALASSSGSSSATPFAPAPDDVSYTELNEYLELLCEVFPEADVDEVRERLRNSSPESRLHLVTETLLKNPARGARRNAAQNVAAADKFRSVEYQRAARGLLQQEFKALSKSTIHTVMIESNYDYVRSRAKLTGISAKSWRYSVATFFRRKKPEYRTQTSEPRQTGCEELDAELRELGADKILAQIAEDRKISALLDEAEHAAASALVECETCYGDFSWNEIAACSEGHFICHSCLIRSVQESIYGQGQSIIGDGCSMRCLSAAAAPACKACIPPEILARVLPDDLLRNMEDKAACDNLDRSGLGLVRCPFCSYAEVDDMRSYRIKRSAIIPAFILLLLVPVLILGAVIPLSWIFSFVVAVVLGVFSVYISVPYLPREVMVVVEEVFGSTPLITRWENAVRRVQLKRRGTLFRCQSSRCKRESCVQCYKEWAPFHKCFEKEGDSIRIHIEKAMANAVKRTCPICRVSFVKAEGCNKLTCVCGYIMCYVCRADIRTEGYQHFCQHFRQVPGTTCPDCDKCDLYVQEDEDMVIRQAAQVAEEEYRRSHGDVPEMVWTKIRGSWSIILICCLRSWWMMFRCKLRKLSSASHAYGYLMRRLL
ncbi:hypothetical protein DFH27DRAFT_596467 [Peziza echinospora]|nr:hypothetical protein DFH27DRAFT_596467 [Peziza echinospora]